MYSYFMQCCIPSCVKEKYENFQLTDQPVPVSFESSCIQPSNASCFQMVKKGPLVNKNSKYNTPK